MNIAISLDKNYTIPAMVMLDSLFVHNSESEIHIFIIVQNKNNKVYHDLKNMVYEHGAQFTILEIKTSKLENAKISHHVSLATYYRLLLADTIPADIEKILFLDCDMLITGPVNELYETDIENYDIVAVEEAFDNDHKSLIGMDFNKTYFNAGVMLVNLKNWRLKNYTKVFIDYLKLKGDKIVFWDQDVLNVSIETRLMVEKTWNLRGGDHKNVLDRNNGANILHFTGKCKPWNCRKNILTEVYFESIIQSSSKALKTCIIKLFFSNLVRQIKNLEIKLVIKQVLLIFTFSFKFTNLFVKTYNYKQL